MPVDPIDSQANTPFHPEVPRDSYLVKRGVDAACAIITSPCDHRWTQGEQEAMARAVLVLSRRLNALDGDSKKENKALHRILEFFSYETIGSLCMQEWIEYWQKDTWKSDGLTVYDMLADLRQITKSLRSLDRSMFHNAN